MNVETHPVTCTVKVTFHLAITFASLTSPGLEVLDHQGVDLVAVGAVT